MRNSGVVGVCLGVAVSLLVASVLDAAVRSAAASERLRERAAEARALELTDLCLFTEARYTRHLSQADLHTPFQDHPFAFEHFPSGSLVLPPTAEEPR
jgi:hypothetical protein